MVTKERSLKFLGGGLTLEQTKGQERGGWALGSLQSCRSQETTAIGPPAVCIFVMFVAPVLSVVIICCDNLGNPHSPFS